MYTQAKMKRSSKSCDKCEGELLELSESKKLKIEKRPLSYKYTLHFDEMIEYPEYYRELSNNLTDLTEKDELEIIFNSEGGYVSSAVQICNMLIKTKAKTKGIIYSAYSAASMIAFCCDELEIMPFGSVMIHDVSYQTSGKNGATKDFVNFISKSTSEMIRKIYNTFLTDKDLDALFTGNDIWLTDKQVKARLAKWVPQRKLMTDITGYEPAKLTKAGNGRKGTKAVAASV